MGRKWNVQRDVQINRGVRLLFSCAMSSRAQLQRDEKEIIFPMKADLFLVSQKYLGEKQKVPFFALLRPIIQNCSLCLLLVQTHLFNPFLKLTYFPHRCLGGPFSEDQEGVHIQQLILDASV